MLWGFKIDRSGVWDLVWGLRVSVVRYSLEGLGVLKVLGGQGLRV